MVTRSSTVHLTICSCTCIMNTGHLFWFKLQKNNSTYNWLKWLPSTLQKLLSVSKMPINQLCHKFKTILFKENLIMLYKNKIFLNCKWMQFISTDENNFFFSLKHMLNPSLGKKNIYKMQMNNQKQSWSAKIRHRHFTVWNLPMLWNKINNTVITHKYIKTLMNS